MNADHQAFDVEQQTYLHKAHNLQPDKLYHNALILLHTAHKPWQHNHAKDEVGQNRMGGLPSTKIE